MILEKILGTIWEKLTISSFSGRQWAYPREFINQLAHHNGYHIEWKNVSQRQMIEASIEADKGNVKPLAGLIHENLADRDIALFIKHNQDYDGRNYKIFSPETGKKYHGLIIHDTERYILQGSINSPDNVMVHNRLSLSRIPRVNEIVEISYPHGDIGLVGKPEIFKAKDFKTYILEKNSYQNEEHEWER